MTRSLIGNQARWRFRLRLGLRRSRVERLADLVGPLETVPPGTVTHFPPVETKPRRCTFATASRSTNRDATAARPEFRIRLRQLGQFERIIESQRPFWRLNDARYAAESQLGGSLNSAGPQVFFVVTFN